MRFLSPPRADNNQQIPQRIQCQRHRCGLVANVISMCSSMTMLIYCAHCYSKAETKGAGGRWQRQRSTTAARMLKAAHMSTAPAQATPDSSSQAPPGLTLRHTRAHAAGGLRMTLTNDEQGRSAHRHKKRKPVIRFEPSCSREGEKLKWKSIIYALKVTFQIPERSQAKLIKGADSGCSLGQTKTAFFCSY